MSPWQFIVLAALGFTGAAGTWFRAWVAYRDSDFRLRRLVYRKRSGVR